MEARIKWVDRKGDIHVSKVGADDIHVSKVGADDIQTVLAIFAMVEPSGIVETVECDEED